MEFLNRFSYTSVHKAKFHVNPPACNRAGMCAQTEKQTETRKPCALCGSMRRRVNPDAAKNITQHRDATFHKTLAVFRSNSVTPNSAVQETRLRHLAEVFRGAFAKSREVPVTLVMSTRLPQCIIAAPPGPHFHGGGGYYENLSRNPNLVKSRQKFRELYMKT
jgi:hypothetical protein